MSSVVARVAGRGIPWDTDARPDDRVRITERHLPHPVVFEVQVVEVDHHGHYVEVFYGVNGTRRGLRLPLVRPLDGEILAFEVVERNSVVPGPREEDLEAFPWAADDPPDEDDPEQAPRRLVAFKRPQRCPGCGALCTARPLRGWPCQACEPLREAEVVE